MVAGALRPRFLLPALLLVSVLAPAAAEARDPGRWVVTGVSEIPVVYWQGLTSDPAGNRVYFTGVREGLWRTGPLLAPKAGAGAAIPAGVKVAEGYNHIGDPSWNPAQGGRVLLPLECYSSELGNTCGTGAFGVADPATLAMRYYVKLDPAEIAKAMWAESSPDGELIWTSSGRDLLAYRSADVLPANAGPSAAPIRAVRRLTGAVPPSGVTGAVFRGGRLFLAGQDGGVHQVWSVDTDSGLRRLEFEREICGEAEGLDSVRMFGARMHWLIAPFDPGCELTYGGASVLLHLVRRPEQRSLRVTLLRYRLRVPGRLRARVLVTHRSGQPVRGARVTFAGAAGTTGARGIVRLSAPLELPGRFRALARKGRAYGVSTETRAFGST